MLDEDVLDLLADAVKARILNREDDDADVTPAGDANSRFVQFPYDDNIDRRDGVDRKRIKSTVYVEDGLAMSCVAASAFPPVACSALTGSGGRSGGHVRPVHWSLGDGRWKPDGFDVDGLAGASAPPPAARSALPGSGGERGGPDVPVAVNTTHDTLWRKHEVSLLAKLPNAKLVKDFRPIAALPVIDKLYSLSLTHIRLCRRSTLCGCMCA